MPTTLTLKNIPDDVYERLKVAAAMHRRSLSSEAIVCLETIFPTMTAPEQSPVVTVTNMKRAPASKPSTSSKKQMAAAVAAAPDTVNDPEARMTPTTQPR